MATALEEEIKKNTFLDSTNSMMPATTAQVPRGVRSKGPVAQPPKMAASLDEALYGPGAKKSPGLISSAEAAPVQPAVTQPVPAVTSTPVVQATPQPKAAGVRNGMPARGTGYVIDNATGKVTDVGGEVGEVASASPQVIATQQGGYGANARALMEQSQSLLNSEATTSMTRDGQMLSEGENAVGKAIVARGLANRAKTFADMGNAEQATQNSTLTANSLAEDRVRTAGREDAESAIGIRGKESELAMQNRLSELQDQYINSTDPAVKESAAAAIAAITGKSADKFQPVMSKDEFGVPTYIGAFDTRTGNLNAATAQPAPAQTQAPASALAYLKANPGQAAAFKAKYGYLPEGF